MDTVGIVINLVEALLYSFLAATFIEIRHDKRILFHIVFTVFVFLETTVSNFIVIYDGLYSMLLCVVMLAVMLVFQNSSHRMPLENMIIYTLLLCITVSITQESDILMFYSVFHILPVEIVQSGYLIPAFAISRLMTAVILLLLIKYTRQYNYVRMAYSKVFVVVFFVLNVIITLLESRLYVDDPEVLFICTINIMMFSIVLFSYIMLCKLSYDSFQKQREAALTMQLKNIEAMAEAYREKEKDLRTIRHNLINQFTVINGYLEEGDIESSKQIVSKSIEQLDRMPVYVHSGFTAIDAILSAKLTLARNRNIQTFSSVQIDDLTRDEEYSTALVLGNLLDNAIENNSAENRMIKVKVVCDNQIMLRVENTTDSTSMVATTTKKDRINHGLGLDSVGKITAMHNGTVLTNLEDGWFIVIVTMKRAERHTDSI